MNETFQWTCYKCKAVNNGAKTTCDCGKRIDAELLMPIPEGSQAVAVIPKNEPPTPMEPDVHPTPMPAKAKPLDLIATNPAEMRHAQHELILWMQNKLAEVRSEVDGTKAEAAELAEALTIAKKRKWNTITLAKHVALADKRVVLAEKRVAYYDKILKALEAGYYIVPPMDMELFAIRTGNKKPTQFYQRLTASRMGNFEQEAKTLPAGLGDYKNPQPEIRYSPNTERKDEKSGLVTRGYEATDWKDIEFPVNMVKPAIMEATSRAMALKIFDELGVLPQDFKRNPDPVILGRIYEPKKNAYHSPKVITFMIAWHLNTKDL